MCGIVGIVGKGGVTERIVNSLKKLEYRGYDSSGVATQKSNHIQIRKKAGKIAQLEGILKVSPIDGDVGIGHTRWATHGEPADVNAHPFMTSDVALVHNGIIENYASLKAMLQKQGYEFESQTDTEVALKLIDYYFKQLGSEVKAVQRAFEDIEGAFAIAMLFAHNDNLLIGMRKGAPLAVGIGDKEMYLGSDALALSPFTSKIVYLDDGEIAVLNRDGYEIMDLKGNKKSKEVQDLCFDQDHEGKCGFEHYMLKEIHEQPQVVSGLFNSYFDSSKYEFRFKELGVDFSDAKRIYMVACGTSYHAAFVAKYWFEKFANIPVEIDFASEFRYRSTPFEKGGVGLFISQSGETADTLAALRHVNANKLKTISLVNMEHSTIAHESSAVLQLLAGYEIGVASTKAFTSQLMLLAMLVLDTARSKKLITDKKFRELVNDFHDTAQYILDMLAHTDKIKDMCEGFKDAKSAIFVGRGAHYPIALEGALKLKEISYIHAEGMAAGELKHGSIALIDEHMPVFAVAPSDDLFTKTASNIHEIFARKGKIICVTDAEGEKELKHMVAESIIIPKCSELLTPIIASIPLQMISYYTALALGKDVDQPRNLAKSVTVE